MGWDYFKPTPGKSTAEILAGEFSSIQFKATAQIGRTFYAAAERRDEPGEVFGLVILTNRQGASFGYKVMDEGMGPCESEAPAAILDLLSPTKSEYAINWRARCRANIARKSVGYVKAQQFELLAEPFQLVG